MALELRERTAVLSGVVTVEEVEELAAWLRRTPEAGLDLRNCNHLHTAALQAILAFAPKITAVPDDSFLSARLLPVLDPPKTAVAEGTRHDHRDAG
ncbi:hypothetical protein Drose_21470 [Dactylosporangium roseum]|uniref:PIN domain-containing protein n=1 Tax=Dactylosporangium roseum TaxID=47989 RepID=A0ABY5YZ51_9ACTN|nr:hypothetical protein [Dactylosporangium roseum]UWZ33843.1 hypothetical protein Drose_21470 [Dactylosporangium roseum]